MAHHETPTTSSDTPHDTVIGKLQTNILQSLFSGMALPGMSNPLSLADLTFVTSQPALLLDTENLAKSFTLADAPKSLQLVSPTEIRDLVQQGEGDVAYLHFDPPKIEEDKIHFNLKIKLLPQAHAHSTLDLSGIQLRFHKVGDEWLVEEPPSQYAA